MSEPSAEFRAHLDGDVTTLCHCWRLSRRDGTVLGFTDHDRPLTLGDTLFEPDSGLTASETRATLGLTADASDVEGALSSPQITEEDIAAGRYDGATVETLLVNWRASEQNIVLRRASIGKIVRTDGRFTVELQNLSSALERTAGRTVRRTCDADLGDVRCGVALDGPDYSSAGAVIAAGGPDGLVVSGLGAFAAGWFALGKLTMTSGVSAGLTRRIVEHRVEAGGVRIVVVETATLPVEMGDSFTIRAGCDKLFASCKAKFDNAVNFRGFPHLPGNDAAYAYVSEVQQFDGGALVS